MAGRPVITNPTQLLNLEKKGLYQGTELVQDARRQGVRIDHFARAVLS